MEHLQIKKMKLLNYDTFLRDWTLKKRKLLNWKINGVKVFGMRLRENKIHEKGLETIAQLES